MAEYEDEDEEDDDNCHQLTTALLTRGRGKNIGTKSVNMSDIMVYLAMFSTTINKKKSKFQRVPKTKK